MSNVTLLSSCSLRWHSVSLVNSVCFLVSPQVLDRKEWVFFFMFVYLFLVARLYVIMKSEVNISCLPQLCPIYFLRLNWSSLCWLGCFTSELQGYTCLYFLSAEIRSLRLCGRLFCGSGVQTQVHRLHSKHLPSCKMRVSCLPSLEVRVFFQKRSNTGFTYLLGMVGWINKIM